MKLARVALAVLLVAGCRDKPEPNAAEEKRREVVHQEGYDEGPCQPGDSEPWPAKGYTEVTGPSPFGILAHLRHLHLVHVGAAWVVHDFPHLFTLSAGKLRALPPIPRPPASHPWQIERLSGAPSKLVVEVDEPRHEVMPTHARIRYTLDGTAWKAEPTPEAATDWVYRTLNWADGRVLDVREGSLRWASSAEAAALDFGAPGKGCAHAYRYLDDALVAGDATFVVGRACTEAQREFVTRFAAGATKAEAFRVAPSDVFQPKYAVGKDGKVFVASDCPADGKHQGEGCYFVVGEGGWQRIDGPEGISPASAAVGDDGTLWVVVGAAGDFGGRAFAHRGPAPVGEVHRLEPGKTTWERLAMPHDPVDGWDEQRFVAETVGTDGADVYVAGFYFYTTKPAPDRVRTSRRFALLRLGQDGKPVELDRRE